MLKKLPIGIQTFKTIREENYLYIDKTKEAYELIDSYSYSFLARPRRFGKSLFIDTLQNIFEGNKELFKGLYIYDKWDWNIKYPVIKIDFKGDFSTKEKLEKRIIQNLKNNQERLQVQCKEYTQYDICFEELIKQIYEKYNQKVIILIDEYDKAILDVIDNIQQAKINREIIKSLYSMIKGNDAYVKFAFLTGVSKFSKASIFSGLNILEDISLNPDFGNICGYTQRNIETSFLSYLDGVDLAKFKNFYNGYNFLKDDIYNPFDTLLFIKNKYVYKNYWFSTGTPTFLIKLIEKNHYFLPKLSNITVDEKLLDSFDIENLDLEVILYQAGYLTIEKMIIDEEFDFIEYKLCLPNKEVKLSFNNFIINTIYKDTSLLNKKILYALAKENLADLLSSLKTMFANIPYNNYIGNNILHYEGFYASVIYVYFQSLGLDIIGEDVTNKGRIDLTIKIKNIIYIIEFKVNAKKGEALQQIKDKKYSEKYQNSSKLYLVGIEFDEKEKNIVNFEWEKIF